MCLFGTKWLRDKMKQEPWSTPNKAGIYLRNESLTIFQNKSMQFIALYLKKKNHMRTITDAQKYFSNKDSDAVSVIQDPQPCKNENTKTKANQTKSRDKNTIPSNCEQTKVCHNRNFI